MILYYKPTCPFCVKVLNYAEANNITFDLRNIEEDDAIAAELVERGGKRQVPYLVDGETEMYESDAIIEHLDANKG